MGKREGLEIDHINRNVLDNRRSNLRYATKAQNKYNNGMLRTNTSGYRGVDAFKGRWRAQIMVNWKKKYLVVYSTKEEAAKAYNCAALNLHGKFAFLNKLA